MRVTVKVNNELIPHQSDETLVGSKEHQCLALYSFAIRWRILNIIMNCHARVQLSELFQTVHGSNNLIYLKYLTNDALLLGRNMFPIFSSYINITIML